MLSKVYDTGVAIVGVVDLVMTSLLTVLEPWILKPVSPVWALRTALDTDNPLGAVQEVPTKGLFVQYSNSIDPIGLILFTVKSKTFDTGDAEAFESDTVTFRTTKSSAFARLIGKARVVMIKKITPIYTALFVRTLSMTIF